MSTIEGLTHAQRAYLERQDRTIERERRRGRPRPVQCRNCKRFKSRPSSICSHCGDEPGTYNGDPRVYDDAVWGERVL